MKVLVAGELNADLILQGYQEFPAPGREVLVDGCFLTMGSASAICAHGLARLGTEVAFAGKCGCDPWGDLCLETLRRAGVDVSRVEQSRKLATGLTVAISSATDRALITHLGAITALRGEDIPLEMLDEFRHLHLSSFFLQSGLRPSVPSLFREARRRGLTTSLDPGDDPEGRWTGLREAAEAADLFFPNEVELCGLTGEEDPEQALRSLDNGHTVTVAKLGGTGCLALEGGTIVRVPAFAVRPVDTTGAGDSFNAGFLHAWLRGLPLREAMRQGTACGALSTLGLGGTANQPDRQTLEEFIRKGETT